MDITKFLAALVIAMLATLICQALYDGLRGDVNQQKPGVMGATFIVLAILAVAMGSNHHDAMAWGTVTGGLIAILAMFAIHMIYARQISTTPRPALASARRTQ